MSVCVSATNGRVAAVDSWQPVRAAAMSRGVHSSFSLPLAAGEVSLHEKYQKGNGEIMTFMNVQAGMVRPSVCCSEYVAATDRGNANPM